MEHKLGLVGADHGVDHGVVEVAEIVAHIVAAVPIDGECGIVGLDAEVGGGGAGLSGTVAENLALKVNTSDVEAAITDANKGSTTKVASTKAVYDAIQGLDGEYVKTNELFNNIDDKHYIKTTLVKDGSLSKSKLETTVQQSLDKADTALQATSALNGANLTEKSVTKAKLEQSVQDALGKAETSVQSVSAATGAENGYL